MKRITTLLLVMTASISMSLGQHSADSITMNRIFGGYRFYQNDNKLMKSQLVDVMKPNKLAYTQIKSAQSSNTLSFIAGMVGGCMLSLAIGPAITGDALGWPLVGIGTGLMVASIPLKQSFGKKARQAVNTYNGAL